MESVSDVGEGGEDHIRGEEGLGQRDAADGRVVQRAFEPLVGVRVRGSLRSTYTQQNQTFIRMSNVSSKISGYFRRPA